MTTETAATVRYYEVCARDAYDVSVVHYTTEHYEYARQCALLLPRRIEPRIYAIYTDGNFERVF